MKENQQVFFDLLRAGLWGKEVRLSTFETIDLNIVKKIAEEQSVVGLVTEGLEKIQDINVPKAILLQYIGLSLRIEQNNISMDKYVAHIINLLRGEGINAILVKGQGLAQCYEKPLWRSAGDIDLLFDADNYEKAKRLLIPRASAVESEYSFFKHVGMSLDGWEVELHGTLQTRLSKRIDNELDKIQDQCFRNGEVRVWNNNGTDVYLPAPDNDVLFVFSHILHHFFSEGIGMRQICDWCRLLWTYRNDFNKGLLDQRLKRMGIMTEWKAFAIVAVDYLGLPAEAMPLYSADTCWQKKAHRIIEDILKVGNFGHNRIKDKKHRNSYLIRKLLSFWQHLGFTLRHFTIFPKDSILFFTRILRSGLHAAVRGE